MALTDNKKTRTFLFLLFTSLFLSPAVHAQYKSRIFEDTTQTLSSSEQQSIASLEQAFTHTKDDYQIATTGQYLARHMLAEKEYAKAAEYYATVLKTQALDQRVIAQLKREYAHVLLHLKRYAEVTALLLPLPLNSNKTPSIQERLLLARADIGLQQFHRVVERLAPLSAMLSSQHTQQPDSPQRTPLSEQALKQAASLYFQAKAIKLAANMMAELVKRNPNDIDLARQLVGLYVQNQDTANALDLWSLTSSKHLFTQEQDWLLLTDLHHRQGSPEKAARIMASGIEKEFITPTSEHYYRLFEYWYHSKEQSAARTALWESVKRSQNIEHALLLAELLQQAEQWQEMQQLIALTCDTVLPDKFVGRINLMQGIALHKQGKDEPARRAFINASLVSGVKSTARDWLTFISAPPATLNESKRLWGDCLPSDPSIDLPDNLQQQVAATTSKANTAKIKNNKDATVSEEVLSVITLPAARFYTTKLKTSAQKMEQDMKRKIFNLIKNLLRSGGKVGGNMHFLMDEPQTEATVNVTIAFPYSGSPKSRSGNRVIREPQKRAVTRTYQGPAEGLAKEWQTLTTLAIAQGHTPSGQARMVFLSDTSGTPNIDVALQLIIQ